MKQNYADKVADEVRECPGSWAMVLVFTAVLSVLVTLAFIL